MIITEEERASVMQYIQEAEQQTPVMREGPSALRFLKEYLKALLFDRPELQQDILQPPQIALSDET